jgi:hypothetical protein
MSSLLLLLLLLVTVCWGPLRASSARAALSGLLLELLLLLLDVVALVFSSSSSSSSIGTACEGEVMREIRIARYRRTLQRPQMSGVGGGCGRERERRTREEAGSRRERGVPEGLW